MERRLGGGGGEGLGVVHGLAAVAGGLEGWRDEEACDPLVGREKGEEEGRELVLVFFFDETGDHWGRRERLTARALRFWGGGSYLP